MNLSKVNERILMKEAKLLKAKFFLDYLEIMDYSIGMYFLNSLV